MESMAEKLVGTLWEILSRIDKLCNFGVSELGGGRTVSLNRDCRDWLWNPSGRLKDGDV